MRRLVKCLLTVSVLSLLSSAFSTSWAQQDLIASVKEGCEKEMTSFCKDVTPGEGRILACLYAYEDKLSTRCEYALYDASAQLEHATASLTYVANECKADLEKHCAKVEAGEGREASVGRAPTFASLDTDASFPSLTSTEEAGAGSLNGSTTNEKLLLFIGLAPPPDAPKVAPKF